MNCPFCVEYKKPYESQFYLEVGQRIGCKSRVLLESKNWYAVPTIGCLTAGYVLIICKQHYLSLADTDDNLYNEMLSLKKKVEKLLYKEFGLNCISFEHGNTRINSKGTNSVDHVHLHVLPFHQNIWNNIAPKIKCHKFEVMDSYESVFKSFKYTKPNSYLVFQDVDKKVYYIPNAKELPSQFFRRCIANQINMDEWNWKTEYYTENITKTLRAFKKI